MLWICIQEIPGSILTELFDYLVIFYEFPPSFQANPRMAPEMRPLPLPQLYKGCEIWKC
jgi:hypothetical protein